jgi:hypothetical protein
MNNNIRLLKLKCGCIVKIVRDEKLRINNRVFTKVCYKHAYDKHGNLR